MWFYLAMGAVLALSLGTAAAIAAGKFPQLSMVDTEALPEEREAQKKREIIRYRLGRRAWSLVRLIGRLSRPAAAWIGRKFSQAQETVAKRDRLFWEKPVALIHPDERRARARKLAAEAEALRTAEKTEEAERKYIDAIALDGKCWEAYRGLGNLYMEERNYVQARETFDFLARNSLKACCTGKDRRPGHLADAPDQAQIVRDHLSLAEACRALGEGVAWRSALEKAVEHEPSNPKHLDLLLEAYVAEGDRQNAERVLGLLQEANPDNQKLPKLREMVAELD